MQLKGVGKMGVEPDLKNWAEAKLRFSAQWKAKKQELESKIEDERIQAVARVYKALIGAEQQPKKRGYKVYSVFDTVDNFETNERVEFWVESPGEKIEGSRYEDVEITPVSLNNQAFLSVAFDILTKAFPNKEITRYAGIIKICPRCGDILEKEFGLLIPEENTTVYVREKYRCRCSLLKD